MALADTANLVVKLTLGGNFLSQIGKASTGLNKFDQSATRAYRAGQQIGTGIKNLARIATGAAVAIGGIAIASAKVAADFESQLNIINTVARASPEALGKIGDSIRKIARDTGTTTEDLTAGYYDLVSAGIKAADAANVLEQANKLSIGGLSTAGEAIDLLTTAINTYGGDASRAAEYTDVFAKAIERGKVTAAELAGSFSQVGPIAAASGISIQELGAAYARLTAAGVPAAEAATQVRSAIVALTKRTSDLEKLEKATKKNYLAIAGDKGLVFALEQMRADADKAGVPLIDLLGRVEGLNFTLATTGSNFGKYNADLAAMGDAAGTAADQMSEREKGLNFQLKLIQARVKDAQISLGTALLPSLTRVAGAIADALNDPEIQKGLTTLGEQIGMLFSDDNIRNGIKAIKDFVPVLVGGAQAVATVVGAAVSLFRTLPPEIQALAVGAFAINKLTGGLVTNLAGGLISGVLKQLVSGVVNVRGASVIVTGAGVPGVGGATGGMGLLSKVFLVGEAIGLALLVNEIRNGIADGVTRQSEAIETQTKSFLNQNPSKKDLENALLGVEQGILDLQRNPLNVLVQGEALTNLQQMRDDIKRQLANGPEMFGPPKPRTLGQTRGASLGERDEAGSAIRAGILQRAVAAGFHPSSVAIERTLDRNNQHLIDIRNAVLGLKPGDIQGRIGPRAKDDKVVVKVSSSIRDTNTAGDIRARFGKTPTQSGAR